jgi:argininosuccinate lyase
MENKRPWGGRFTSTPEQSMQEFSASIHIDRRLLEVDVEGSMAYARGLHEAGVLDAEELERTLSGLAQVAEELAVNATELGPEVEDIHMAVEGRLIELIGPLGGKLHTGRSRNDQVCTDERLFVRASVRQLHEQIRGLQTVLVTSAEEHIEVLLPGYTHLQQAQPILFSHYALALFWMLERDYGRLEDVWKRADLLPLGCGALAGSAFPLDRQALADDLGFTTIAPNSLDAVSDRDFLLELLGALSILMMHLSRYCEDLIIWSSSEFGFVALADAYSTGSSMMPQKKNPDSLELVRGKTGRVYGDLLGLLTTMKGIPLTYSRDMQEDKEPMFDALDTVLSSLQIFSGVWQTMELRPQRMRESMDGNILATDLADYLVRKGTPFREAHRVVGELVLHCEGSGLDLTELNVEDLRKFSPSFDEDTIPLLEIGSSPERRSLPGGTSTQAVIEQLANAKSILLG